MCIMYMLGVVSKSNLLCVYQFACPRFRQIENKKMAYIECGCYVDRWDGLLAAGLEKKGQKEAKV